MKKFLFSVGLGFMAFAYAAGADYVVYNNGTLNPDLHVYGWYNDASNFKAANPDGAGEVYEFKAADGSANASMGLMLDNSQNTGILNSATLNFNWYATGTGTYTIRLTSVTEENYAFDVTSANSGKWNAVSLNVAEIFPTVAKEWKDNTNLGNGYIFSIILESGSADATIYFDNIYYSNVDESWRAPETEVKAPANVPSPSQASADVLSIFSSAYSPATTFNIGYWGQATNPALETIDGKEVYYLRNFNYLGWELNSDIDVSGYDYMHVDFWTPQNTSFGFTPISRGGSATEKSIVMSNVALNEWNNYDIALSEWANAGLDLSKIFQIKFDQGFGAGDNCYIANVYFWKDENGGGSGDDNQGGDDNDKAGAIYRGTVNDTYTQTMSDTDIKDYDYSLSYEIIYNEDKTLTLTGKFDWPDGNPVGATDGLNIVIPGIWVATDGKQGNFYTSDVTFEKGNTINITFQTAVALGNVEKTISYVVGSSSVENPGEETGVEMVEVSNNADIYSISGVRVAKAVDFNEIKNSLAPGLYIVGGKKVIIK